MTRKIFSILFIFTSLLYYSQEMFVNTNKLNVREKPDQNSKVISQIEKNTKVEILGDYGEWSKIEINGKSGYINEKFLSVKELSNDKIPEKGFKFGFEKTFMKIGIWIFFASFILFKLKNDKTDGRFKNGVREAYVSEWSLIKIGIISLIISSVISFFGGIYFWILSFF